MKISDFSQGRDNNFNLLRMLAALAVLISHSFPLTGTPEPFQNIFGFSLGNLAVDIFFVTSGFLVTGSLLKSKSGKTFFLGRVLRIYPALIVMLIITVLGVGLYFTTLSLSAYLLDHRTHRYFLKCATLIANVVYKLPGVFENNPYKDAVNGSLWSLPYEIKFYAILFFLWLCVDFVRLRQSIHIKFFFGICFTTIFSLVLYFQIYRTDGYEIQKIFFMFFAGSIFYLLRSKITLSYFIFLSMIITLAVATINKSIFSVLYYAIFPYILLYLAYVPSGFIRKYNLLGDYSYGVYIYAFIVQQSIAALVPGITPFAMMLESLLITLCFAVASWHFLEKPMLTLKKQYSPSHTY